MATKPNNPNAVKEILGHLERFGKHDATVSSLIELYRADREMFFRLATSGVGADADAWVTKLTDGANTLRKAVSGGISVKVLETGLTFNGMSDVLPLGTSTPDEATSFVHELRGATNSDRGGKDYVGQHVSQEEISFALGDPDTWASDERRVEERMNARPTILRLDETDRKAVEGGMPPYVVYGLKHCATKLVQNATVMYPGLRRDGRLKDGRAYCGRLRHMYDNEGNRLPAPHDMVYVVYVDPENYVFDWDWVEEVPSHPGHPVDPELRFLTSDPIMPVPESALVGVEQLLPKNFKNTEAWHSQRGDCVFCYFSDTPAFAKRINDELTVFYDLHDRQTPTGFKVKNIRRMVADGHDVILKDAPDLTVAVQLLLLYTLGKHPNDVRVYDMLIRAWLRPSEESPQVNVQPLDEERDNETVNLCS
ncbi:MAG: hypothetical protein AABZ47_05015 [Planctomycetota bacterium]